jgi:acyl-[acyl-carrier-protein]-phospholipid O-acyltransferase/long-chain-fatty-acid--[acyl-carrier-protein] ligase
MNSPTEEDSEVPASKPPSGLMSASFLGLLFTQLLTAINDNIFRWLVIGVGKEYVDKSYHSTILTIGTSLFVLPYLLFAAPAGYLADRFSKRTVIIVCKFAEIVIMLLGVFAIWLGNLPLLFLAVALTGTQSALFSPSKMGIIPEILRADRISAANGWFGLTTVSATVVGMAIGNYLSVLTHPRGQAGLWISALVLLGVAVVGTAISYLIHRVPAASPWKTWEHWPAIERCFV